MTQFKKEHSTLHDKDDDNSSSEEEDSSEMESDGDEQQIEIDHNPVAADENEDEEEDNDDEEDDEEEEEKIVEPIPIKPSKRKQDIESKAPGPTKKKKKMSSNEEIKDENTIYVSNISPEVTLKKMKKLFPEASNIRFPTKYDGASKGFGFLVFDKKSIMETCLSEKQGTEIEGKELKLTEAGDGKTMYVKGINRGVTEIELNKLFPDATNIRYPMTGNGKPKGYAFIQFKSESEVKSVVAKKQGMFLKGDKLFLDSVSNRKKDPQTFRAYGDIKRDGYSVSEEPTKIITLRNLSYDLTDKVLMKKFEALSANLITDPETGKSKGRAYLHFKNKREAKEVTRSYNTEKLEGRIVYIYYAKKIGGRQNPDNNQAKNIKKPKQKASQDDDLKEDYSD